MLQSRPKTAWIERTARTQGTPHCPGVLRRPWRSPFSSPSRGRRFGGKNQSRLARKGRSPVHVRAERFRKTDRAIRLLMILEQRNEDARARDGRVVEREGVDEIAGGGAHANVRAARLKLTERRARVGFAVGGAPRHPRFDLVLSRLPETYLAR